jgi:putative transposase
MDNVFIERLWSSLKYEDVYLEGYADGREARRHWRVDSVLQYRRPHLALANKTPMAVWRNGVTGALGDTAVDITLRLDNSGALPTCSQPPQHQQIGTAELPTKKPVPVVPSMGSTSRIRPTARCCPR